MTDPRPAPLVPPEVDLRDFPGMMLDVGRLRSSELVVNEPPEICWAALRLWCAAWHEIPAGSVPNNDRWLANAAGYLSRGQIDPHWDNVRTGALRGFVECSDGRLYHSVTSEKAREAWALKQRQRWISECARVKKHNQRHGMSVATLDFEQWLSLGCPTGQPLPYPDAGPPAVAVLSSGQLPDASDSVPGDNHSKRREEKGRESISPTNVGESTSGDPRPDPDLLGDVAAQPKARKRAAAPAGQPDRPADVADEVWTAWLDLRRKKRAPVSGVVLEQAAREAALAKLSLEDFLRVWCFRGTQGLMADWIRPADRQAIARGAQDRVGTQLRTAGLMVNPPAAPERTPAAPASEVIDVTARRVS